MYSKKFGKNGFGMAEKWGRRMSKYNCTTAPDDFLLVNPITSGVVEVQLFGADLYEVSLSVDLTPGFARQLAAELLAAADKIDEIAK